MTHHFDLVVRAARAVVDGVEQPATIGIHSGVIAAISLGGDTTGWTATSSVDLAADEVLLPGMVDSHVHVNEPGRTDWEGFTTATRAALRGGTTTIIDMPLNSLPPTTTLEGLQIKRASAAPQAFVDVGFWGGAVPGNLEELEKLDTAGVFGFKCFLVDSGVPEFPPLSREELRTYLARCAELDALLIVHAEDAAALDSAPPAAGPKYADFVASRPDESEVTAIESVIAAMRETGGRAHILHLSSAKALPAIRAAKAAGLPLTVETCPHYLTFTAETIRDGSTAHKCCPPIRSDANRTQLWDALADGTIDLVVSDHSPCTVHLKQLQSGDFGQAWGGVASVQLALSAVWTEARSRGFALTDVVRWMSTAPADLVGLTDKGRIAVGAAADLIAFAPDHHHLIDAATLEHKNKLTAYQDLTLDGDARRVWLRGRQVTILDDPHGTLLTKGS
ncbi:allantoinase AllB [Rudaeicoccus suwonensis]|uniref:allantoinase n=1 Tax=Rudaeicoccus suwonensis TaxID=657409 RepID=A0A561E9Z4_9MICO|nr:allantoinase AllB [Rudaeicoccus suwonensis]TWE12407.1 allantoinase [Rudaeicoccus suwonensis]